MSEVFFAHQIIGLYGGLDVISVNANRHSHDHVLRSFNDFSVDLEQVTAFKSLEAKEIIVKVPGEVDDFVQFFVMSDHELIDFIVKEGSRSMAAVFAVVKLLCYVFDGSLGQFSEVVHCDSSCQDAIVRMDHVLNSLKLTM